MSSLRGPVNGSRAAALAAAATMLASLTAVSAAPAGAQQPAVPAIEVDPAQLHSTQPPDRAVRQELTIGNSGDAELAWEAAEEPADQPRSPVHPTTPMEPVAQTPDGPGSLVGYPGHRGRRGWTVAPEPGAVPPEQLSLTHTDTQAIVAGASIACSPDPGLRTFANGYLRHFSLADFGIVSELAVTSVSFGVESMRGAAAPVDVNLYTVLDPAEEFRYDNFAPLGTAQVTLRPQRMSLVEVPVTGTVPAGGTLVVEIAAPELRRGGLYLAAHLGSQTAPSYLRAEACGLPEPAPTATLGAGDLQLLMNVTGHAELVGCVLPEDLPWLTMDPLLGTVSPGASTPVTVTFDSTGMADGDEHAATLCLRSDDPTRPRVEVPVSLRAQVVPEIAVTPAALDLTQRLGETSDRQLTVGNLGDGTLDWQATVAPDDCGAPAPVAWLDVSPGQGSTAPGGESAVAVTVDTAQLPEGAHAARVCLDSNDPERPTLAVPVSLTAFGPACDRTIVGAHPGPLTVTEGVTCLAPGSQVQGEVNVLAGAGLIAESAVIQGPLATFDATYVELTASQLIGPAAIRGTTVRVAVTGTQVVGSVLVVDNRTDGAPVIAGNTVVGSLFCTGNEPPPVDGGTPNTVVGGLKLDQCAGL